MIDPTTFIDLERRAALVAAYGRARAAAADADDLVGIADVRTRLRHRAVWEGEARRIAEAYTADLPRLPISRCPFTGEIVEHSFDPVGLDGPWWDAERPARPLERVPETFLALSGAVFVESLPRTEFVVHAGPGVPFVYPEALEGGRVIAVISSLKIGEATAYAVAYYRQPGSDVRLAVEEWGTDGYRYDPASGAIVPGAALASAPDIDLGPWIGWGRLRWIHGDDAALEVHGGVPGCPYLDLPWPPVDTWAVRGRPFGE